jgi:hypothetical protein
MKRSLLLFSFMLLGAGFASASAINAYNTEGSFLAALYPGYYQENFGTFKTGTSLSYSGAGFGYTITDSSIVQTTWGWLQEAGPNTITITFTSGNVTAIGGDFFAVNTLAQPKGTTDTLTFSDGTTTTITTGTSSTSFTGYTFNTPITSMTVHAASSFPLAVRWTALDDLIVGTAAPEPGTWTLLGAGMGLLAFLKLRRR